MLKIFLKILKNYIVQIRQEPQLSLTRFIRHMLDLKDCSQGRFVLDFAVQSKQYMWYKVPYRMFPVINVHY